MPGVPALRPRFTASSLALCAVAALLMSPSAGWACEGHEHEKDGHRCEHEGKHDHDGHHEHHADSHADRATHIAERSTEAMGGDAWDDVRFLRFDFFGFRTHHWDRHENLHRLEGTSREGESYVVVQDLDTREGQAWVDGERLTGDDAAAQLEQAYGAWINDTYWLLMPMKLLDPGVHLSDQGSEEIDGKSYDKLEITFEQVGLTPGDTYWAWFDPETGLMHQWAYHLEGWEDEREPTAWRWLDWRDYGDVTLSSLRRQVADGSERSLGDIAVFDHLDASVFQSPERPETSPPAGD